MSFDDEIVAAVLHVRSELTRRLDEAKTPTEAAKAAARLQEISLRELVDGISKLQRGVDRLTQETGRLLKSSNVLTGLTVVLALLTVVLVVLTSQLARG